MAVAEEAQLDLFRSDPRAALSRAVQVGRWRGRPDPRRPSSPPPPTPSREYNIFPPPLR